jgi:hypothetical protein
MLNKTENAIAAAKFGK